LSGDGLRRAAAGGRRGDLLLGGDELEVGSRRSDLKKVVVRALLNHLWGNTQQDAR